MIPGALPPVRFFEGSFKRASQFVVRTAAKVGLVAVPAGFIAMDPTGVSAIAAGTGLAVVGAAYRMLTKPKDTTRIVGVRVFELDESKLPGGPYR